MLRPYVITVYRRRSRDPDAPAATHAEIRPRFFGGTGRLESPPFEGDRRPLEPTPQRIGTAVGAAPGQIDEPSDHAFPTSRSEEHTSELQSQSNLVCRLLLEKKKKQHKPPSATSRR